MIYSEHFGTLNNILHVVFIGHAQRITIKTDLCCVLLCTIQSRFHRKQRVVCHRHVALDTKESAIQCHIVTLRLWYRVCVEQLIGRAVYTYTSGGHHLQPVFHCVSGSNGHLVVVSGNNLEPLDRSTVCRIDPHVRSS